MNIKNSFPIFRIFFLLIAALWFPSCVHELPEEAERRDVTLSVIHSIDWDYLHIAYASLSATRSESSCSARYIIRAYPKGSTHFVVAEKIVSRPVFDRSDFTTVFNLPAGDYDIYVWGDADDGSLGGIYYVADDFGSILFPDRTYKGNTEDKDAFVGVTTVSVPLSDELDVSVAVTVELYRPLAAYAFIATDLRKFIDSEIGRRTISGASVTDDIELGNYTVNMRYSAFLPSEYNLFTSNPSDSRQGVNYTGNVVRINDNEALIGFDYLFVNGAESAVSVDFDIRDYGGSVVASVPTVNVPTRRGVVTIVRGEFLTSSASGGTIINPEFLGEFNISF